MSDGKILFLEHVRRVGQYVRDKKKIIPIIWDDMLRSIPLNVLQVSLVHHFYFCFCTVIGKLMLVFSYGEFGDMYEYRNKS